VKKLIRKAVFPVAGLGTRFLPATKASPKEMLPIVDKPLIQYAAEEAISAGIEQLIFVTSSSKRAIEDHFDKNQELENSLEKLGKREFLNEIQDIVPRGVSCLYIRQPESLGLGHAVLCAKPAIGNEPFAVILADDLIKGQRSSCLSQMLKLYEKEECSILAVEEIDKIETEKYGIISPEPVQKGVYKVKSIVEKPKPDAAPSTLAVVGRYLLSPSIFTYLEKTKRGAGNEIQLTDGIAQLLKKETVLAYQFRGVRYDCGSKLGYLIATVEYALRHQSIGEPFKQHLMALSRKWH
jgi:UTP--glucose-1-phosphate uridylyltransferase